VAPLVAASGIAVLFGLYEQVSGWSALATLLEFVWELSLGIWLIVKGFNPSPVTAGDAPHIGVDERSPALAATAG
jgi:hypothetical protein